MQAQIDMGPSGGVLDLPYAWQEAQLGDGHPYHPCHRSRIGFDLTDHQRYGPEFAQGFTLAWLALDKRLSAVHGLTDGDYVHFLETEIGAENLAYLQSAVTSAGKSPENYFLLPVYP